VSRLRLAQKVESGGGKAMTRRSRVHTAPDLQKNIVYQKTTDFLAFFLPFALSVVGHIPGLNQPPVHASRGTQDLMVSYYRKLQQGLGRGEALRRVQLEMLKQVKRKHPYYWACFIQSGEWAKLK
jgi:CHAT domain